MVFVFSIGGEVVLLSTSPATDDSTSVTETEVSPLVTVSSRLVTGPLTLMMCEWGDGVLVGLARLASSSSLGLSSFEAVEATANGGEAGTSRIDSLDFLRPPAPPPVEDAAAATDSGLFTVITVEMGDVGLVDVEDLDDEVTDDRDSLVGLLGDVDEV